MNYKTRFELIIDHNKPLNPELLGQALSTAVARVPARNEFHEVVTATTVTLTDYNQVVQ